MEQYALKLSRDCKCKCPITSFMTLYEDVKMSPFNGNSLAAIFLLTLDTATIKLAIVEPNRQAFKGITIDRVAVDRTAIKGTTIDRVAVDRAAIKGITIDRVAVDRAAIKGITIDRVAVDRTAIKGITIDRVFVNRRAIDSRPPQTHKTAESCSAATESFKAL